MSTVTEIVVSTVDTIIYRAVTGRSITSLRRKASDIIKPDIASNDRLLHTYLNLPKEM